MDRSRQNALGATPEQRDAIAARGDEGCREAARAIGRLFGTSEVDVRECVALAPRDLNPDRLGSDLIAVGTSVSGVVTGRLVLALATAHGRRLAERLLGVPLRSGALPPGARSALCEAGNIIGSAFLTGFGKRLPGYLLPAVPRLVEGEPKTVDAKLAGSGAGIAVVATVVIAGRDGAGLTLQLSFLIDAESVAAAVPAPA